MPLRSHDDATTLAELCGACRDVAAFLEGAALQSFPQGSLLLSAVCFKFVVLGEASARLSGAIHARFSQIPWKEIRATRNYIVHEYDRIDVSEIWRTATIDVPVLLEQLRQIQTKLMLER
jgi:uncharacterized protein with HEPN domain